MSAPAKILLAHDFSQPAGAALAAALGRLIESAPTRRQMAEAMQALKRQIPGWDQIAAMTIAERNPTMRNTTATTISTAPITFMRKSSILRVTLTD